MTPLTWIVVLIVLFVVVIPLVPVAIKKYGDYCDWLWTRLGVNE